MDSQATRFIPVPEPRFDARLVPAYAALCEDIITGRGGPIRFDASLGPKHEFLAYLVDHTDVVLHGTTAREVAMFRPARQTDYHGRQVEAVFATRDSIWPIFFAILDRSQPVRTVYNGCLRIPRGGTYYHFSIDAGVLPRRPWTTGAVYILPGASFRPVATSGSATEEWVSADQVRPLAWLEVTPADFPFLDEVTGHDPDELARFTPLLRGVLGTANEIRPVTGGLVLKLPGDIERVARLAELLVLFRKYRSLPGLAMELLLDPDQGPARVRLTGPPGVISLLAGDLGEIT